MLFRHCRNGRTWWWQLVWEEKVLVRCRDVGTWV
jgi:hypothetical protein